MPSITASLASVAALSSLWAVAAGQKFPELSGGIYKPSVSFRNVYPAENFNRGVLSTWWHTKLLDNSTSSEADKTTQELKNASYIVLDDDFYELLGVNKTETVGPEIDVLFDFPPGPKWANRLTHDGTVYSPECNCLFYVELYPPQKGFRSQTVDFVWRTNLTSNPPKTEKVYPKPQLTMANGAYYHNGSVFFAHEGNVTVPGGIVKMDPITLETEVVLNNWYGHRFNSPNDVVITSEGVAFFTDGWYGWDAFNDTLYPEIANGVWRWDMATGDIRQFAGAGGGPFTNPNGIALNAAEDTLYVTNRGNYSAQPSGGRTIYEYSIGKKQLPVQSGTVFSYQDSGFPDGIKVDDAGRVYGGSDGGINVFDSDGKRLGIIKVAEDDVAINMQWVGDHLYYIGRYHLYRVQLNAKSAQAFNNGRGKGKGKY